MPVLIGIAVWFGLAGVAAAGWSRFFSRTKPVPLPEDADVWLTAPAEHEMPHRGVA
jgi:hypothetical protein